jgi:predicted RNase H-like HicB family nuclease
VSKNETIIRLHVELLEEGGYLATSPDVPGLVAEGSTIAESVEIAQGIVQAIVESCLLHDDPLPPKLAGSDEKIVAVELVVPVAIH